MLPSLSSVSLRWTVAVFEGSPTMEMWLRSTWERFFPRRTMTTSLALGPEASLLSFTEDGNAAVISGCLGLSGGGQMNLIGNTDPVAPPSALYLRTLARVLIKSKYPSPESDISLAHS